MSFADFVRNKLAGPIYRSRPSGETSEMSLTVPPVTKELIKANSTANRCFNMIVDAAASIEYEIIDPKKRPGDSLIRPDTILELLNRKSNTYVDAHFMRRSLFTDFLLTGNFFAFWEKGSKSLYYLPAGNMTVTGSTNRLVENYTYAGDKVFQPEEIIHCKDNSFDSVLTGSTRLESLGQLLDLHTKMKTFQRNFFNNNAMPGIVLLSPNTLTDRTKERKLAQWAQDFNPMSGARKPAFLDGGITIDNLSHGSFKEMDFENSIKTIESDIAKALGVPPILLDGGNNANISPNLRLFYLETVMPLCEKFARAFSLHFGYQITPITVGVPALQPDLRDLANYVTSIVNGGIISPEEGRIELGFPEEVKGTIRVPQNIAGSASNPSEGGRPKEPQEGEE